jgi:cellulose synthase/poly-beta-1,6-N-acetylglucosamine synthase-like glycosyltransferase
MMVRREAITDIGPLDEGYFLHCEDLDWCMRASRRGWKILFVPEASFGPSYFSIVTELAFLRLMRTLMSPADLPTPCRSQTC